MVIGPGDLHVDLLDGTEHSPLHPFQDGRGNIKILAGEGDLDQTIARMLIAARQGKQNAATGNKIVSQDRAGKDHEGGKEEEHQEAKRALPKALALVMAMIMGHEGRAEGES